MAMGVSNNSKFSGSTLPTTIIIIALQLLGIFVALVATTIGGTFAFSETRTTATNHKSFGSNRLRFHQYPTRSCFARQTITTTKVLLRNSNVGYNDDDEYRNLPPNPDASPGSFHLSQLRSSYPPGTPPGLRGEAVRSAMVTTERCLGWNLSTNAETASGGVLQISGRGTLEFLNGKFTRNFSTTTTNLIASGTSGGGSYKETCLLDAKGRLVDVLRVSLDQSDSNSNTLRALILTSPGHTSADLLKRLDPFVFPMDEVELTNFCNKDNQSFSFTLASTQYKHVQKAMLEQSNLSLKNDEEMVFPGTSQSTIWKLREDVQVLVVPSTGISEAACVGYTFCFFGSTSTSSSTAAATLGRQVWERLIGEDNPEGPVEVGALEYETLRVESGQPAFGFEYGIDRAKTIKNNQNNEQQEQQETKSAQSAATPKTDQTTSNKARKKKKPNNIMIKTSPLELHFNSLLDLDKGCYLGQEGIASVLKNPRGAPRTLYTVVFEDDFNTYETQSRGDESDFDNLTTLPKPGQKLFALGSNEELQVGTITSMGEAGGTGSPFTVGLALIKRADSIRRKMKTLDLEIPRDADDFVSVDAATGSGIIQPPPLDPLDGLEVIVEGTFTMGMLKAVPARQLGIRRNSNMFDLDIEVEGAEEDKTIAAVAAVPPPMAFTSIPTGDAQEEEEEVESSESTFGSVVTDDDSDLEEIEAEVAKATAEAEAAATEAKRKAEKMELLKKRAEEAMVRRKAKAAAAQTQTPAKEEIEEEDAAAIEARRKAEKMELLQKRAEEAMARRKAKKEQGS